MVPGQGGRGAAARHIKVPRLGAALCPLFASAFCVLFLASCVAFAVDRSASPRVMVTKAVCVLKGDGLVQGTIHFEQKARTGGGRPAARPCPHTCARERPAGPRAALATPLARGSAGRRVGVPRVLGRAARDRGVLSHRASRQRWCVARPGRECREGTPGGPVGADHREFRREERKRGRKAGCPGASSASVGPGGDLRCLRTLWPFLRAQFLGPEIPRMLSCAV